MIKINNCQCGCPSNELITENYDNGFYTTFTIKCPCCKRETKDTSPNSFSHTAKEDAISKWNIINKKEIKQ